MASKINTSRITYAFRKTDGFKTYVRIGAAAFRPRLTDGTEKIVNQAQSSWAALHPAYAAAKQRQGQDPRKWVRTGRTLRAMTNNVPTREGTRKGLRFKIQSNRRAIIRPAVFGPLRGKRPNTEVQKKILAILTKGVRLGKGAKASAKNKRLAGKTGRPGRELLSWQKSEVPAVTTSVEKEMAAIMREAGLPAKAVR